MINLITTEPNLLIFAETLKVYYQLEGKRIECTFIHYRDFESEAKYQEHLQLKFNCCIELLTFSERKTLEQKWIPKLIPVSPADFNSFSVNSGFKRFLLSFYQTDEMHSVVGESSAKANWRFRDMTILGAVCAKLHFANWEAARMSYHWLVQELKNIIIIFSKQVGVEIQYILPPDNFVYTAEQLWGENGGVETLSELMFRKRT